MRAILLLLVLTAAACDSATGPVDFPPGFTVTAVVQADAAGPDCSMAWSAKASHTDPAVHYFIRVTESHSFLVGEREGAFRDSVRQVITFRPAPDTSYPLTVIWRWGKERGGDDILGEGTVRIGNGCVRLQ